MLLSNKNKVSIYAATRMNIKNTMLSERKRTQAAIYFLFMGNSRKEETEISGYLLGQGHCLER